MTKPKKLPKKPQKKKKDDWPEELIDRIDAWTTRKLREQLDTRRETER